MNNFVYGEEVQKTESETRENLNSPMETGIPQQNNDGNELSGDAKANGQQYPGENVNTTAEARAETPAQMPVYTNPAMQNRVNEQYRWSPEDPSFLYEIRNIPDHRYKEEFLPTDLEKVEVKEHIKEEVNFRKSLGKIKIRLPDMTQTLILASIIILVLVYRTRARKYHDSGK